MAKSIAQIEFDFQLANTQATELETIAKNIRSMLNDEYEPCMTAIAANWQGENAEKYVNKGDKLKGKIKNSAKDIDTVADTIRAIAKNTYDAEMAAARIAGA